jgi:alpha-glucosidase
MHPSMLLLLWGIFSQNLLGAARLPLTLASPDGAVVASFALRAEDGGPVPVYSVTYRGKPILLDSALGLTLEKAGPFGPGFAVEDIREESHSGSWKPPYGERNLIPENYRQAIVTLVGAAGRKLQIVLRAYNEGAAVRYVLPEQPGLKDFVITSENTEFHFPEGARAWETHGAQQGYESVWVKDIQPNCDRPLAVEFPDGRHAAVVEAGARNYPVMLLSPAPGKPGTLVTALMGGPVIGTEPEPRGKYPTPPPPNDQASKPYAWGSTPFATPWRGVIVGDRAGDLIERDYLVLNLNEPSVIADTSWIEPGKSIRVTQETTEGGKAFVDFAKQHGLKFITFDSGWYGSEWDLASDATKVALPNLDLPEVIHYAKEKGIGVIVYVGHAALERQMDVIAPLYEKWGVKGIKFGFVNFWSQYWTKCLYDWVETAAKHKLMVDIHDEFRPTGLSRTYPNLMTQEGIAGNETMPTPNHNTVLPFTRFLAGPADYTICYYTDRIKTTRAHQLALAVVYYSPWQFLYWGDSPSDYHGEPEIEFFDKVPTTWDDTKVIDGQIGRYVTVARRSGDDWFVGTITNGNVPSWYARESIWHPTRNLTIPLKFLPPGRTFLAHIYENGKIPRRDVKISTRRVDASSVIEANLPLGGGQAIWLEAQKE